VCHPKNRSTLGILFFSFILDTISIYISISISGTALGIGRGCDGLGPLPIEGPKIFFNKGGVYRNI